MRNYKAATTAHVTDRSTRDPPPFGIGTEPRFPAKELSRERQAAGYIGM